MTTVYFTVNLTQKDGRSSEWTVASNVKDPRKLGRAIDAVQRRIMRDYPEWKRIKVAPIGHQNANLLAA